MSFGFGDLAGNALFGITGAYLIYYYINVYGLSPASVAILMLMARVVDSGVDPVIGYLIDHRLLFNGKIRPYLGWFSLPLGFLTFCCFLPLPLGSTGRLAWAYATYLAMGILFSLVIVPYGLLPNTMTRNREDRLMLSTFRMMGPRLRPCWWEHASCRWCICSEK
ncbi:MFS transporter [Komagataeibacter rhaeticus]|nr:MFS transporter [Komagataeibacter rhaeticus]